jgi:D-aminoacyl-tRNA deacylase
VRAVVQRVRRAEVRVDGEVVGAIGEGLLVLVGVARDDDSRRAEALADKVAALRIFRDAAGKMQHAVRDVAGSVLVVSQFTLFGDTRRGNRPSFIAAAPPEVAEPLVAALVARLRSLELTVAEGRFGAAMEVESVNDGPVTLLLDTEAR